MYAVIYNYRTTPPPLSFQRLLASQYAVYIIGKFQGQSER